VNIQGTDKFRRVRDGQVEIDERAVVAGWDDRMVFTQRICNYTAKPIDVEVRRAFPGHVEFRSGLKAKNHDYQTVEFTATVESGKKADHLFEVVTHQGRNAKQNNVTVEAAEVRE
jgi:hypothetical protein